MIQFILGMIAGGFIGMVAVAMSVAAKEDNRYRIEQWSCPKCGYDMKITYEYKNDMMVK
jgi:uncharacterized lipoprotein YehR (DUF1307 family)